MYDISMLETELSYIRNVSIRDVVRNLLEQAPQLWEKLDAASSANTPDVDTLVGCARTAVALLVNSPEAIYDFDPIVIDLRVASLLMGFLLRRGRVYGIYWDEDFAHAELVATFIKEHAPEAFSRVMIPEVLSNRTFDDFERSLERIPD